MHSTVDARTKLLAALEREGASVEERAAAGDELGAAGDPRATAIDRVLVPGGPFEFSRAGAAMHVSAFAIDRYPVTVGAFAEFLEAGGYRERGLWSEHGWAWRVREKIVRPRFWGEAEWAAYLVPNHPVVGVSAFEAEAFAAWRGARLPTEAEWEKACRGASGRAYPWGQAWAEEACQRRGYGPRGTVAIGLFPRGGTPDGIRELVGCVWQWCRDVADDGDPRLSDKDPVVDPDDYEADAKRVTRGGGWNNLEWNLTCTSRNGYPPSARFSNLGFRCVVEAVDKGATSA